jgi:hypothetical protein
MNRPKKKRPACRRFYLRKADELPRPDFTWKANEIVLGPPLVRRPPPVEPREGAK